jgi:hypothetical protein
MLSRSAAASVTGLAFALALSQPASAEELERPARESAKSASAGAFLPWTMGARSDTQQAFVYGQGGYGGAEKGAVFQTVIEAQVYGRVSLRAGGEYTELGGKFRPEVGLRLDALRQERNGVDLAVVGGYESSGFNTVRAVTARVAVSRAFGDTRLVSNLGCGFGVDEGERYGDFRLAGLQALTDKLHVGLDSRLRVDLERDASEPAGEPSWELTTGPVASYALGRFVLTASGGLSALKLRQGDTSNHVGAIGTLGLGAVF